MSMKPLDVIKCVDESMNMLHRTLVNYIAEHQTEKGFINTSDKNKDIMWAIIMDSNQGITEYHIKAVKVEHGDILIFADSYGYDYTEDEIRDSDSDQWYYVSNDDYVYCYPTLYQIGCSIHQYVNC